MMAEIVELRQFVRWKWSFGHDQRMVLLPQFLLLAVKVDAPPILQDQFF
jgi:hypothetical protein